MIVREASIADVPMIAQVHVDTWRSAYRGILPEHYLASLSYEKRENGWMQILKSAAQSSNFVYVAAEESGQIVGFASGGKERTGDALYKGELSAIYVLDTYQRRGIGLSLTRAVVDRLAIAGIRSMLVWVLKDNPSCRFYEAIGGQKVYEKQIERGGVMLNEVAYGWTTFDIMSISP
jgi:L-amino acid N-acyltransferase YncA